MSETNHQNDKKNLSQQSRSASQSRSYFLGIGVLLIVGLIVWQPWKVAANPSAIGDDEPILPKMVNIAGGEFTMGCLDANRDGDCKDDEKPAHQVSLDDFWISQYEITNAEFAVFLNAAGNQMEGEVSWYDLEGNGAKIRRVKNRFVVDADYAEHPVVEVSWYGAQAYATWLSQQTGQNYRLPTEAEWEYAARGGAKGVKDPFLYSGSNDINEVAWNRDNSGKKVYPVGKKKANQLGLYDMSGNVWEWCSDRYSGYTAAAQQNPGGPASGGVRVLRGGSWFHGQRHCRASHRYGNVPTLRNTSIGFRLARS